jgi:hypothetical protein
MSPNMLVVTMTSKLSGLRIGKADAASTVGASSAKSGYSAATRRTGSPGCGKTPVVGRLTISQIASKFRD